ncbi:MAG: P1 family peptidase [Gemmatimonadota bacterium]|nr:MAG: P1 family peptidase [Gemmatimonadota bacterium]
MASQQVENATLTAVPGLAVGHASAEGTATGCTVVLGPFRAAVDVRGLASGTRQLDSLAPQHLVPGVDALLLAGGSAYGLAAADGVASWLEEQGRGLETRAGRVAIVPSAVIFDLGEGRADRRPDAALGRAACKAASRAPVAEGRVGVGAGATVGKLFGRAGAMLGGVGSAASVLDGIVVGALVVVNAFGDVLDREGRIIAGARGGDGAFADTAAYLRDRGAPPGFGSQAGTNTTLGVVATDAPLSRVDLQAVARQAMNAVVRRISPANTEYDGDLVFACSTADEVEPITPEGRLRIGLRAEWALARAIERAVRRKAGEPGALEAH